MITTKTHGLVIWIAAVLLGTATSVILKRLGVFDAFAEASGFSVGAMVTWLWAKQWVRPSESGWSYSFATWSAIWIAPAFLVAALRIAPLF